MDERNKQINELLKFYKDKDKPIHITLKSGDWLNGKIISIFNDRLVLDEEKYGEMLVLFERIKDDGVEPREKKRGENDKNK